MSSQMENWILGLTNLPILYPLKLMWNRKDFKSFTLLSGLGICSVMSHLGECHRKDMQGVLGLSTLNSKRWHIADKTGTYLLIARLLYLFWKKNEGSFKSMKNSVYINNILFILFSLAGVALRISEWCDAKHIYVPLHSVWHISVYPIMALMYQRLC